MKANVNAWKECGKNKALDVEEASSEMGRGKKTRKMSREEDNITNKVMDMELARKMEIDRQTENWRGRRRTR